METIHDKIKRLFGNHVNKTSPYKCPAGTECTMEREVQLNVVHKYKAIPSFQEKT